MMRVPIEVKVLLQMLGLGIILSALAGVLIYFTPLPETISAVIGNVIMGLCVLTGAILISRHYGQKGLIHGLSFGVIFFTVMIIISLIFNPAVISFMSFALHLLGCLITGALGGIIGLSMSDLS